MSDILIPTKSFLGKYYPELLNSSYQEKYSNTNLVQIFDQKFQIQNNKVQMVIDQTLTGLSVVVAGNEIYVSTELYNHDNVIITNSLESTTKVNPRTLYNPQIFSTLAYLICQNHTTFQIIGDIEEPIYVKYITEFETFYNSVVVFDISNEIHVEIVEEIESKCALNSVANYILFPESKLNLTTFYNNNIASSSFFHRNVILRHKSTFMHTTLGRGSANVIDETKIAVSDNANIEISSIINSEDKNFHSILHIEPFSEDFILSFDQRQILGKTGSVTLHHSVLGTSVPESSYINASSINPDDIPVDERNNQIKNFTGDIIERTILERMVGVERFYNNKTKFCTFYK